MILTLVLNSPKICVECLTKMEKSPSLGIELCIIMIQSNPSSKTSLVCSRAKLDVTELWHKRLGHINYRDPAHIDNKDLLRGILKLSGQPKSICGECMKGKHVKGAHKKIQGDNTSRPLDLLHMDLMGPMRIESKGGRKYVLMVVDHFSRYCFVPFLREES